MLEIYLIRHGITLWNAERRFQGQTDIPLSEVGRRQAMQTRDRLQQLHFDAIYSSSLKRAYETAQIIAGPHHLEVTPVDDLCEIHMGIWQGQTISEIQSKYPEIFHIWQASPTKAVIPECEGVVNAAERSFRAFKTIGERHQSDERIAIVAHGLVNAVIITQILGEELDYYHDKRQGNTAVNIINFDGRDFSCVLLNCTSHCDEQVKGMV